MGGLKSPNSLKQPTCPKGQHSKMSTWAEIGWPSEENGFNMLAESGIQSRKWELVN